MTAPATTGRVVAVPLVAALTTWVALLSWRTFSELPNRYLGPLLVLGLLVAGAGVLARSVRTPGPLVVLLQLVVAGVATSLTLVGTPLPLGDAWPELVHQFETAGDSAQRYQAPVPANVPSIHPILVVAGLGCFLIVDLLAATLRRVPLVGLPLLTVYSVPVSLIAEIPSWWVFALTATGFLTLLFLEESDRIARWGRSTAEVERQGFTVRGGTGRNTAGLIGGITTGLALAVPVAVPTLNLHLLDLGFGSGGGDEINIDNPMIDLRRDLLRGPDVPMVRVRTDDRSPSYLRIAVLNRFSDNEWSSGDRDVPTANQASGEMPAPEGVFSSVERREHTYRLEASSDFESRWLPTYAPATWVRADGDWRYDRDTMDFLASRDELDTENLSWEVRSADLELRAEDLLVSSTVTTVDPEFTEVPENIDPIVRDLATQVTASSPTWFEKAVALQEWFRTDGGFVYDDTVDLGNGGDDLVRFLTDGPDGRRGYCEQFAAAMTVMARELGIPARVAVGFLEPQRIGDRTWEFTAHDLHAWPELFFPGAGWVRFEPTPGQRAPDVPGYTTDVVSNSGPEAVPTVPGATQDDTQRGTREQDPAAEDTATTDDGSDTGTRWGPLVALLLTIVALALLGLLPRTLRTRRRTRRLAGGAEAAWQELRDTVRDLGMPWPAGRSPRQTRDRLLDLTGGECSRELDVVVQALEEERYAPADYARTSPGALREPVSSVSATLEQRANPRARRLATWWPRSLFDPAGVRKRETETQAAEGEYVGSVEHMG